MTRPPDDPRDWTHGGICPDCALTTRVLGYSAPGGRYRLIRWCPKCDGRPITPNEAADALDRAIDAAWPR